MSSAPFNPEQLAYREPDSSSKKKFRFPKVPKLSKRSIVITSMFVLGISLGAGGIYGWQYYKNQPPPTPTEIPDERPPQDVLGLIEAVEKDVPSIPKNEIPSVATVKDLKSLSDQAFFEGAAEGDKLMIYTVAKRAFLYRPSTKKVIRQGPVEIIGEKEDENEAASSSAVLSASESASAAPALRIKY